MAWLRRERGLAFADYDALWEWSSREIEALTLSVIESGSKLINIVHGQSPQDIARLFSGQADARVEILHCEDDVIDTFEHGFSPCAAFGDARAHGMVGEHGLRSRRWRPPPSSPTRSGCSRCPCAQRRCPCRW